VADRDGHENITFYPVLYLYRAAAHPLRNKKAKYFKALPFLFFLKTLRYQFESCTLVKVRLILMYRYLNFLDITW
jgi:hypothetical protein